VKISHGLVPATSNFYAIYYVITGLHGLHVLGGIIVIGYLAGPGSKLWNKDKDYFANRIECAGLYWHFVDLVWIFAFPIFYLM
jgi:heme/copper-type cytochrome/quinol oxidase subunit 3